MIDKLKSLIEKWEKERDFLCGPNDPPGDRAIGKIYGECAAKLKAIIASQPIVQADAARYCVCDRVGSGDTVYCGTCGKEIRTA